jgi:hypothetical protein
VYDPTIGRFLQADLVVQAPGQILSYNRYAYVWNNPKGYTDPSGYFTDCGCPADIGNTGAAQATDNNATSGPDDKVKAEDRKAKEGDQYAGAVISPDAQKAMNSSGGGLWSGVKNLAGKIWNLPNTAVGLGVSALVLAADLVQSTILTAITFKNHFKNIGFNFGNNAFQVRTGLNLGSLRANGGLTIGNVILYNNSIPEEDIISPYKGNPKVNLGRHEARHTFQGERLGIFYLPAMLWHGVAAPNNPLEIAADNNSRVN